MALEEFTSPPENPFTAKFQAYFETQCKKQIERLVAKYPEKRSLYIDFTELEHFDFELADELIANPDYVLAAAKEAMQNIDVPALEIDDFSPHIRIFNLPAENKPILRDVSSSHLEKLVSVDGVVGQVTQVLPKLKSATWECRRCGKTYKIFQKEQTPKQPVMCECRHKDFQLRASDSEFVDYQKIKIQEPLENLKGNEPVTTLDVYVGDDMVNMISPGDRTRVTGVLRLRPPKDKNLVYERYLDAIHIQETAKEFEQVEISKEEEEEIRKLAANEKIYDMIVQSIAPNIYGHENVKEAISLQLFGGVRKVLPNSSTIRGNVHVLLVGEPGMAKSQILQAVNKIAPKSIYIAGKTTTSAGISATAVKDDFGEGGWTLKAGALVLASGGICLVDEMDKMDKEDRSALHEAMEQETISVAKAGIVTRFKTETIILAAANPKYSRFDPYQNYFEQIDLPATLISRFDLFFLIRDVLDRKKDEEIATHILRTHQIGEMSLQYNRGNTSISKEEIEELKSSISPVISADVLKKYISYARQNVFPVLSKDAIKSISDFYVDLRDQGKKSGSYAATHRQLEALVRLCEASARIRLKDVVDAADVERSLRIFRSALEDLVVDKETGRIDIDIVTSGTTHTQITNLRKVLGIIRGKAAKLDMVPMEEVVEEAKAEGIEDDKTREIIERLLKEGDIYKPRHGFLKPTQK